MNKKTPAKYSTDVKNNAIIVPRQALFVCPLSMEY